MPRVDVCIRPVNFEDDGPEALIALKTRIAAERGTARRGLNDEGEES
jgi:hypothetical protein